MAISTYGSKLSYSSSSTGTYTDIAVKSKPSVLGKRSALETTTMSDDAQTYIQGIRQQSETFDYVANFDKTLFNTLNSLSGSQYWKETLSDGSTFAFEGEVSVSINESDVDSVEEMTISIYPTTVPTFTAGT